MQKHTPGPWCVKRDKTGLPYIGVVSDPSDYPGTVATVDGGYPEGDARLIAAAPDMLDALKRIADGQWDDTIAETTGTLAMREIAREAIRKATGAAT
jgi:hypothetical protein